MAGVAAAAAIITATAATTTAVLNYEANQDAAAAQRSLAEQQAATLDRERADAAALANKQAGTGAVFGNDPTVKSVVTGLGFGSGGSGPNTGFGRAVLTGGSNP